MPNELQAKCSNCPLTPLHLVLSWRGVNFDKPVCPECANKAVQKMIKNNELDNPFTGDRA